MDLENFPLFISLDEQTAVGFTGRLNVLDRFSRQLIGLIILKDGEIFRCDYRGSTGLKAFNNMAIESAQMVPQDFIVEPEIISNNLREIHATFDELKTQVKVVIQRYLEFASHRPPDHLRLMIKSDFLKEGSDQVSNSEFDVMCSLTEWSKVEDLYRNCPLQDYEITEALVMLRKKDAIKVVALRSAGP